MMLTRVILESRKKEKKISQKIGKRKDEKRKSRKKI